MSGSITASNAVVMASVAGLFPVPQQISFFAADDIFDADAIEPAEYEMGVDGHLAAGLVFVPVKWSVSLMANSPSNAFFDAWRAAQLVLGDLYFGDVIVKLPSIRQSWLMSGGSLSSFPPFPNGGKVLKARKYGLTFESLVPTPF